MKVSEQFKSTINAYLDNMAAVDSLFAPVYQKPTKNIDNCITYILNQVKKSGCCGFSDDEIFGMALHYYQEDNIEVGSPLKCNVVVKLSLHYMTRTIHMIDYQKHLYFCSCHNIKIIGFAKTPLDLYLFSKNFLLVIIEALFSQRLFQSPPFWLFRQPLHIFQ